MEEAEMRATAFARNWQATRQVAKDLAADSYISIVSTYGGEDYEIARWSRYSNDHDAGKLALYLPMPTAIFGEALADMLDHTAKTGIGKLVTFRDAPRYVLDPGGRWRSYQAARLGVSRPRYTEAIRGSRTVQRILEKEGTRLRKDVMTLEARVEASEAALRDMAIDYAAQEDEVRYLRREAARLGQE